MTIYRDFFALHPVFHHEELVRYLKEKNAFNQNTLKAALQYHISKQNISRIRRGYYLVINPAYSGHIANDYILIAGRMTEDAVISYHSAIEFHALTYSMNAVVYFCSKYEIGTMLTSHGHYQQVSHPAVLKPDHVFFETKVHDRQGLDIRVTTIERTLVDCLARPQFTLGWEEIWRSFEGISFLDIDRVIAYALRLGNATTIAKLGFFLEQHQEIFDVTDQDLIKLEAHKPKSRHYMDKSAQGPVQSVKRWNLIVPLSIINKDWEEPNHDDI